MIITIIQKIVRVELMFLFWAIFILIIASIIFNIFYKIKHSRIKRTREIVLMMLKERFIDVNYFLPRHLRNLEYIYPVLSQIDSSLNSIHWSFFKDRLVKRIMHEKIALYIRSRSVNKCLIGMQVLHLAPLPIFEKDLIHISRSRHSVLRFSCAKTLVKIGSKPCIYAVLKAMSKEHVNAQFPYRDALLEGQSHIYALIKNIYDEEQDEKIKICCLKILSLKMGFLGIDDIKQNLAKQGSIRWWSIKALENMPTKESLDLLADTIQKGNWAEKSLAISIIGTLRASRLSSLLKKYVNDEHYWVRFMSTLVLSYLGDEGKQALQELASYHDKDLSSLANYILSFSETSKTKGVRQFFAINQDPSILIESLR